jgi:hypothetical protein
MNDEIGIGGHIDDPEKFGDTIVSVSMCAEYIMDITNEKLHTHHELPLPVRSALVLKHESRYNWKHGIANRKTDPDVRILLSKSLVADSASEASTSTTLPTVSSSTSSPTNTNAKNKQKVKTKTKSKVKSKSKMNARKAKRIVRQLRISLTFRVALDQP